MSNTERQLRQTIEDQDKEICLLKDQLNRLTDINNNLWNLFIEQSKQIKMKKVYKKIMYMMGGLEPTINVRFEIKP